MVVLKSIRNRSRTSPQPPVRSQTVRPQKKRAKTQVAGSKKIRTKELPPFSRQLSAMLLAGMPIIQALDALEDQAQDKNMKMVVLGLKNHLQSGASFTESLSHYPDIFDDLYVNMIRAGESGGQLGETAARLAGFLEASARLTRKVKSAMSYPVIVLCIALVIAAALILFIVPVFAEMFDEMGAELPGLTQIMITLSDGMRAYGVYVILLVIAGFFVFRKWTKTPAGAVQLAAMILKLPVVGELNRKIATSRFARTFAQLLNSGVPILSALEIVSGATGNKVFEKAVKNSKAIVEQGDNLSAALLEERCFPKLLVHMLAAGEKTGKIDDMMQNIADFYDDEVEATLDGLTALIEPLLMVFLGVIIGGIVMSMFLPVFKMGDIVSM